MKIDLLSIAGIIASLLAVLGGNALEGGRVSSLVNGPALLIVFGGTLGAALLQTPLDDFLRAIRLSGQVFITPQEPFADLIKKMMSWCNVARREGLLGLEDISNKESDLFVRKGMQLLVDGLEPVEIRKILEMDLDNHEQAELQAASMFEAMGGYSPTIGIIGAVMGLIHVMQNLADPSMLGAGIATAFVATIYGVSFANLLLLPFAAKLKSLIQKRSKYREMVIEGIVAISEGENPRNLERKLESFLV